MSASASRAMINRNEKFTSWQSEGVDMRSAIYARSAVSSEVTMEEQVRICCEFAREKGWVVSDAHVFGDGGRSGMDNSSRLAHSFELIACR